MLLSLSWTTAIHAQTTTTTANPAQPAAEQATASGAAGTNPDGNAIFDPAVKQASCSSCGGYLDHPPECAGCGNGGCANGGCGNNNCACYPGQNKCWCDCCFDSDTPWGKCLGCFYKCVCCPDPCYEPHWFPLVDSAFFVESARPVGQMDLIWDSGFNLKDPDRAEYFYARENVSTLNASGSGRGPAIAAKTVNHDELSLYMEAATPKFGMFVITPYREVDFHGAATAAALGETFGDKSGFGDIEIGTKSVLLDCDCMLISFGFNTFVPSGDPGKGLGTGHVSLDPALLFAFRLTSTDYLQAQLDYWIPLGGDHTYQGNIFHAGLSWNHLLWQPCSGISVVGTVEAQEWTVLGGNYTEPDTFDIASTKALAAPANTSMVSAGPGARVFFCNKIDFGIGTQFALTGNHWDEELVRAEFRWRF